MMLIIALGLQSAFFVRTEMMPPFESNLLRVTQVYPGAAPGEVQQGIVLKIEEALKDIDGIKRLEASAYESLADISIEVLEGYDLAEVMNEVKIAIDSIATFPEQAERPVISKVDFVIQALQLQLYGDIDEKTGKALAEEIKNELLTRTRAGKVLIHGVRRQEGTIEVPEYQLRKYGITLDEVARRVGAASVDLPAGSIRTSAGQILLRTQGQARWQQEFERIVLLTRPDGTRLRLGEIATVVDGFEELEGFATFDHRYSVGLPVFAVGDQDVIAVAESVKAYVQQRQQSLPDGVYLDYWADMTHYLDQRLAMMTSNLMMGDILVILVLSLFLELKLAFWVTLGMPLGFLGALAVMPLGWFDLSINMMSVLGFILVLGIVVDDAIIIGESVNTETTLHGHSLDGVIRGTRRVALPATFGVLTTVCAFMPTLFVPGSFANFPRSFGLVVILCLLFSLVESKFILPAHLAHGDARWLRWLSSARQDRLQRRNNERLQDFIRERYRPFLQRCIDQRYATMATFVALLILIGGLIGGGWLRYVLLADVDDDYVAAKLEMARGTPEHKTREALEQIGAAIHAIDAEYAEEHGNSFIKHVFSYGAEGRTGAYLLELVGDGQRELRLDEIADLWRDAVGDIPGARTLSFQAFAGPSGADIQFNLVGNDYASLAAATSDIVTTLNSYDGLYDVRTGASDIVSEIQIDIRPGAQALGLSLADIGRQVREAFYGAEAQRIQRGNDEVKVMVRYPLAERKTVADLENMYIRTPEGQQVPILSVAELSVKPGQAQSTRINREQAIEILAMVHKDRLEPSRVTAELVKQHLPELKQRYPGVDYRLDGMTLESKDLERSLLVGMLVALFGIFALLAIPLRSYAQPLIIMSVIPFGVIGAAVGHMLLGMPISMLSIFGIIALTGVVVNDSLIMVDFVNRAIASGQEIISAVVDAGCQRFRAIMLTSVTTFLGILPLVLESSPQAEFIKPMATSLAFGIVFATVITLVLVPCLYVILDDWGLVQPGRPRGAHEAPVVGSRL